MPKIHQTIMKADRQLFIQNRRFTQNCIAIYCFDKQQSSVSWENVLHKACPFTEAALSRFHFVRDSGRKCITWFLPLITISLVFDSVNRNQMQSKMQSHCRPWVTVLRCTLCWILALKPRSLGRPFKGLLNKFLSE